MKELNKIRNARRKYFIIWSILEERYRFYGDIYDGDNLDERIKKSYKILKQKLYSIGKMYGITEYQCKRIIKENEIRNRMKKRLKANYCTSRRNINDDDDFPF